MIELLEGCVRIRSLSGQEREVAEYLRNEMAARGFRSHIDRAGNAVGVIGDGARQIVLLGHMDTVDGDVPVRYEDGQLYGRGTVDAKGPLCAFILAAAGLARVADGAGQDTPGWQIIVIGATEEEAATSRGARFAATQYRPEVCVIGEPSGTDGITLGYKGRLLISVHFEQTSRHSAVPGPGSAEQAVLLWNWLHAFAEKFNKDRPKAFDQVMPALRQICSSGDGLREWCDMQIGLRLPIEMGPQQMQREVERWCSATATETKDQAAAPPVLLFEGHEQAYRTPRDTPLAYAFVDAIRHAGLRPVFKLKTGTADLNVVGPIWQCPIVAYGPGDSSLDHTPVEHVDVAEFERSVHILQHVLQALMAIIPQS